MTAVVVCAQTKQGFLVPVTAGPGAEHTVVAVNGQVTGIGALQRGGGVGSDDGWHGSNAPDSAVVIIDVRSRMVTRCVTGAHRSR